MTTRVEPIFVAGATGYTGSALVSELAKRGASVVAHVRPDSPRAAEWIATFEALGAKVDQTPWGEGIHDALVRHRAATVVALLGTTRARGKRAARSGREENYETVDYGLTMMLLRAAEAMEPAPRFVYLSALGADGSAPGKYLAVRKRVEEALKRSRLPHVVVRPSFITGSNRAESRPGERAAATVVDGVLTALSVFGATGLRDQYGSMTNQELAVHLADVIVQGHLDGAVLEPKDLRRGMTEQHETP